MQELNGGYLFSYDENYEGEDVSLTMPKTKRVYHFTRFPSFFEDLLPEGIMLEGPLRINKIDKADYLSQLIVPGNDLVGAVTVKEGSDE